ncbi:MAG: hypothetical protein J6C52_04860 [Clostridia bacterium]|nr:hypothetical protein [Clostridia bacterium]
MKRIFLIMLAAAILLLAACREAPSTPAPVLQIAPAALSEETERILGALGLEAVFFDYISDGEAETLAVKLWLCTDGTWKLAGETNENLALYPQGRIALDMREDGFLLANITDGGHMASEFPQTVDFTGLAVVGAAAQTMTLTPERGEEVTLWLKTGSNAHAVVRGLQGDFRENRAKPGLP